MGSLPSIREEENEADAEMLDESQLGGLVRPGAAEAHAQSLVLNQRQNVSQPQSSQGAGSSSQNSNRLQVVGLSSVANQPR